MTNILIPKQQRDKQFSKGIVVAMPCEILKINNKTYRVQSEFAVYILHSKIQKLRSRILFV